MRIDADKLAKMQDELDRKNEQEFNRKMILNESLNSDMEHPVKDFNDEDEEEPMED